MVSPKTYRGYDKDGNVLCTVTAVDANEYINPAEVRSALDKVKTVAEEGMENIVKALNNVEPDASEAVIVQGTKMTETINEVCTAIKDIPENMASSIEEAYPRAVSEHDRLQNEANDTAYNGAWISGVTNVR